MIRPVAVGVFSLALDGRDALGPQLRERRAHGENLLAELPPEYPDRLRRTVLSSADDLLRASR